MIRRLVVTGVAGLLGGAVTAGIVRARRAVDPQGRLERTNHAGRTVSLIEGPAVTGGLLLSAALLPDRRERAAALAATAVAGGLGFVDDMWEQGSSKGLRGHLGALARGEVTTGALKVAGIPAVGLLAAAVARRPEPLLGSVVLGRAVDTVVAGGVIAGTANLFNLLDLRPGRALKAGAVAAVLGEGTLRTAPLTAGALGVIAGGLPDDLAGDTMLGDTGANALGAALGTRFALSAGRGRLVAELAILAALTLASEKVSFTRVIESTPGLRELDAWGRRASAGPL